MRALLACLVALGALSACGTEIGEPGAGGEWTQQRIDASPGGDSPVGLPADGDDALLVTVPEGEDPEVGVRYHAPLYLHCGMGWLHLGDRPWQRTDDGPDVETGAGDPAPEGWPVSGQTLYGYATLGADGVVSYTDAEGGLIATYERTGARPPGCD